MAARIINGTAELKGLIGEHLGYSDWMEITQERVNQFAEATGDHQWIHVDPERAKAESPFGGPIAHGYLTLSLGPVLMPQVVITTGFRMGVTLISVEDIAGGVQVTYGFTFECEGAAKPSCVAEVIFRSYE